MSAFPSYSVGTVSVKKGDAVIVGAGGTIWTSTVNVQSGDDIIIAGHIWPISDVTDANHLAIDPWPFDDVPPGTPYKILQRSPLRFSGATAAANVMRLVNAIDTEGVFRIAQAGAAAPDPSLGEENQFALQPSTFKLWLKTGGAWVFQGIFKGFRIQGPYSATAAYLANDIVSQDGASYVALVDNTGQPVTNAAVWALFAAKGDPGAQGPQGVPGADGKDGANGTNGHDGAGYAATSVSSLTIGAGLQALVIQAGLAYSAGARVRISSGANFMEGVVASYDSGSGNLTVSVDTVVGSGTFNIWNVNLAGQPGSPLGQQKRFIYTAAAGQTTFSGADGAGATLAYTPGSVEVAVNGLWLPPTDYAATDGTSIVFPSGSNAGDVIYIFALSSFNPMDALAKSQNGADIVDKSGFVRNLGIPAVIRSYLAGLTLSTAGASPIFSIGPGVATDSTNVDMMTLAAAINKTTAAWAVGSGNGALDTGAIAANTWYNVHHIKRVDTGVTDILLSTSATAPKLPANYTLFRRIGSVKTNASSQWLKFSQFGDEFLWDTVSPDYSQQNPGTNAQIANLNVPPGVQVIANLNVLCVNDPSSNGIRITISPLDVSDEGTSNFVFNAGVTNGTANQQQAGHLLCRTNTSGQIRVRFSVSVSGTTVAIGTRGWFDRRGRDN